MQFWLDKWQLLLEEPRLAETLGMRHALCGGGGFSQLGDLVAVSDQMGFKWTKMGDSLIYGNVNRENDD